VVRFHKANCKTFGVGAAFISLYTLWHIGHTMVLLHAHLIFLKLMADKTLYPQYIDNYQFWVSFGNYMGSFTGGKGTTYKWCGFIVLFFVLMLIYDIRYAALSHLGANLSAALCIWLIRWVVGFYPQIKIGPANYFINLKTAFAYTSCALLLAIALYLPLYCYKKLRQGVSPWHD